MNFNYNTEYNLLSGLPIKHETIGVIYQPTLKYLISNNIDYIELIKPFIVLKKLVNKTQSNYLDLIEQFFKISKLNEFNDKKSILTVYDEIIMALKVLYKCDYIEFVSIGNNKGLLIKQDENFLLNNQNIELFLDILFKIFFIDINKIIEEDERELTEIEKYIKEKREQYKSKMKKKKDEITLIVSYLTHCDGSSYNLFNIWDLTIYQLYFTFKTFKDKEKYDVNLKIQLNGMSKDNKLDYWLNT